MIGFLAVLFIVVVVGSFPATWLLMLFLGNVGVNVGFWGALPAGHPDDVLRRGNRRTQPLPLVLTGPRSASSAIEARSATGDQAWRSVVNERSGATEPHPRARSRGRS